MNFTIKRNVFASKYTLGTFLVDGKPFGFTCEDTDRKLEAGGEKVAGETAIPRGRYPVIMSYSQRFKKPMPEVLDVTGFTGIRIHGGNTKEDTHGCPLLGSMRTQDGVANCRSINDRLITLLEVAEELGNDVWLTVE